MINAGTHLWADVCGVGTRYEFPEEAVQLRAFDVTIPWNKKASDLFQTSVSDHMSILYYSLLIPLPKLKKQTLK